MKKRICTLLLALCLTLGLLPAAAQAAGDGSGTFDTVRWTLDADGGLTVSGTGDLPDGAFAGRTDIVTVTFTGQVARIGRSAFAGCTQLRRVDGFGAVTCVMSQAFAGCTALTELAVPGTVAYLRICFLGVDQTQAQGINLLYFLPTAGMSLLEHRKNGYLDREVMRAAIPLGTLAALAAAWAATSVDITVFRKPFGVFLLWAGANMLLQKKK